MTIFIVRFPLFIWLLLFNFDQAAVEFVLGFPAGLAILALGLLLGASIPWLATRTTARLIAARFGLAGRRAGRFLTSFFDFLNWC